MRTPHETHVTLFSLYTDTFSSSFPFNSNHYCVGGGTTGCGCPAMSPSFSVFIFLFFTIYEFLTKIILKKYIENCTQKLCDELVRKKIVQRNFPNKDNFRQVALKNYPPDYLKKILCVKIVYIVKVVLKNYF